MRPLRLAFACAFVFASAAVGCELIAGLQDRSLCDAGCTDSAFEAAINPSFSLAISPPNIIVDRGGPGVAVALTLTRVGGFGEAITVSLTNPPAGISGSTIIPGSATTGTLNVTADMTAVAGQVTQVTVTAESTPSGVTATQPLLIRVGHVLLTADASTTFVVPSDVQNATIAAWGGGGGGGGTTTLGFEQGASGGAGGFAEGTFPLKPGATLSVFVAAPGGPGGAASNVGYGGAGGGYSGVMVGNAFADGGVDAAPVDAGDAGEAGSPYLIVAGGGGGGGGGYYYSPNPPLYSGPGRPGGAGSGANGTDGVGVGGGKGGTTTAGGVGGTGCGASNPGSALQGGNTGAKGSTAGVPGGGFGGTNGGGGGGAGFFGGGSGAGILVATCNGGGGGGGGGGHVDPSGSNVTTTAGVGQAAPATSNKFYVNGVAIGGITATAGGPGLVVIYLP